MEVTHPKPAPLPFLIKLLLTVNVTQLVGVVIGPLRLRQEFMHNPNVGFQKRGQSKALVVHAETQIQD